MGRRNSCTYPDGSGGRRRLTDKDSELIEALPRLVDPMTRGDPQSPLRWTGKSTSGLAIERLATELMQQGHPISARTVARLLKGGWLQPARQSQNKGRRIASGSQGAVRIYQCDGEAISAARSAGDFGGHQEEGTRGRVKNVGREWQPQGEPESVAIHDFADKELGKVFRTASTITGSRNLPSGNQSARREFGRVGFKDGEVSRGMELRNPALSGKNSLIYLCANPYLSWKSSCIRAS